MAELLDHDPGLSRDITSPESAVNRPSADQHPKGARCVESQIVTIGFNEADHRLNVANFPCPSLSRLKIPSLVRQPLQTDLSTCPVLHNQIYSSSGDAIRSAWTRGPGHRKSRYNPTIGTYRGMVMRLQAFVNHCHAVLTRRLVVDVPTNADRLAQRGLQPCCERLLPHL